MGSTWLVEILTVDGPVKNLTRRPEGTASVSWAVPEKKPKPEEGMGDLPLLERKVSKLPHATSRSCIGKFC